MKISNFQTLKIIECLKNMLHLEYEIFKKNLPIRLERQFENDRADNVVQYDI